MQITTTEIPDLFAQLGLPTNDAAIAEFVKAHPLPEGVKLHEAVFWTNAQRQFLNDCWQQDSDWVVPIDKLDALLRHQQAD